MQDNAVVGEKETWLMPVYPVRTGAESHTTSFLLRDHFNIFYFRRLLGSFDTEEDKRAAFSIHLLLLNKEDFSYHQDPKNSQYIICFFILTFLR